MHNVIHASRSESTPEDLASLIESLYTKYADALFYYAATLLEDENEAAEALQNMFLGLVRTTSAWRAVRNWQAYLFGAVRCEALKLMRQRRRERRKCYRFGELARLQPCAQTAGPSGCAMVPTTYLIP